MPERVERVGIRQGYDLWSRSYDERASTLVRLERRITPGHLHLRRGERVLDAGCGTGGHLGWLEEVGVSPVGVDLSGGMLAAARRNHPRAALVQADLDRHLPLVEGSFDVVLCSLVSEHLSDLSTFFSEMYRVLAEGGRLVFSAFHPEMAAAGVEARFEADGTEYRLGAELHTVEDFARHLRMAGFGNLRSFDYPVDDQLVAAVPSAAKHLGRPMLLLLEAERGAA